MVPRGTFCFPLEKEHIIVNDHGSAPSAEGPSFDTEVLFDVRIGVGHFASNRRHAHVTAELHAGRGTLPPTVLEHSAIDRPTRSYERVSYRHEVVMFAGNALARRLGRTRGALPRRAIVAPTPDRRGETKRVYRIDA